MGSRFAASRDGRTGPFSPPQMSRIVSSPRVPVASHGTGYYSALWLTQDSKLIAAKEFTVKVHRVWPTRLVPILSIPRQADVYQQLAKKPVSSHPCFILESGAPEVGLIPDRNLVARENRWLLGPVKHRGVLLTASVMGRCTQLSVWTRRRAARNGTPPFADGWGERNRRWNSMMGIR